MRKKLLDRMRARLSTIESVDTMTTDLSCESDKLDLRLLRDNEFRQQCFRFKPGMKLKNVDAKSRIPYFGLTALLRNYVIGNDLLKDDFHIQCDSTLKTITNKDETSFFDIAKSFTAILE